MVGDGSPIAMGIRVQEKFPKKYWMVHFICGGFHTYKNMWGKLGRTVRAPLLRSIYAGYRDNDRQLEYVSSPSDPRDCKDEAAIIESSRIFDVADAYESQPSYVENPQPYQGKQTNKGTLPLICSSFGTSVRKFAPLLIFLCLNLGRLKCRSRWSTVQHLTCKRLPLLLVNCQLTLIDDGIDTRLSL